MTFALVCDAGAVAPGAVVLVEGESDRAAVEALACRRGRDLAAEGVEVVVMNGAHGLARCLRELGPPGDAGLRPSVVGLYDAGEERDVRRALDGAGIDVGTGSRAELAAAGFHACVADLEDELIRALGVPGVEAVVEANGEGRALATLRRQPAQQGRTPAAQLRRFLGSKGGRKIAYGRLLVEALDDDAVPAPLHAVVEAVAPVNRRR